MLTTFIIICSVFTLITIACVCVPLWTGGNKPDEDERNRRETVLAILRQQSDDLERDREAGRLDVDEYEEARLELEHRVLEETRAVKEMNAPARQTAAKIAAVALAIIIPASAVMGYLALGRYTAMDPAFIRLMENQRPSSNGHSQAEMQRQIEKLQDRVKAEPRDANGWFLLARACASVGRYDEALQAFRELSKLVPNNADIMADMADMMSAANGKVITPEVVDVLQNALKINPNQWKALALLAIHSWDRERYADAAAYWERLLKVVPPDFSDIDQIRTNINEAKRLGGVSDAMSSSRAQLDTQTEPEPAVFEASVSGTVLISDAMAKRVKPDETVFIYARAVKGSAMPLAFLKIKAKDLPYNFKLTDHMTVPTGGAKLSDVKTVIVGARVSPSGNFMPQAGDLEGEMAQAVQVGDSGVIVTIDTVHP